MRIACGIVVCAAAGCGVGSAVGPFPGSGVWTVPDSTTQPPCAVSLRLVVHRAWEICLQLVESSNVSVHFFSMNMLCSKVRRRSRRVPASRLVRWYLRFATDTSPSVAAVVTACAPCVPQTRAGWMTLDPAVRQTLYPRLLALIQGVLEGRRTFDPATLGRLCSTVATAAALSGGEACDAFLQQTLGIGLTPGAPPAAVALAADLIEVCRTV